MVNTATHPSHDATPDDTRIRYEAWWAEGGLSDSLYFVIEPVGDGLYNATLRARGVEADVELSSSEEPLEWDDVLSMMEDTGLKFARGFTYFKDTDDFLRIDDRDIIHVVPYKSWDKFNHSDIGLAVEEVAQ